MDKKLIFTSAYSLKASTRTAIGWPEYAKSLGETTCRLKWMQGTDLMRNLRTSDPKNII